MSESMRPPLSSKNSGPTSTTSSFMATKHPIVQAASGVSEVRTKNECHPEQSWARFLRPTESKGICGSNGTNMSRTSETGQGCPESKVQFTNVVILSVAKRSRRILSLRYHLIRQPHH